MKYAINTDSIQTTIEANSADEAAVKFAQSEKISGVSDEADLVAHYEGRDGWCNINAL